MFISDDVQKEIVRNAPAIIAAIASALGLIRTNRANRRIDQTKTLVNGRMSEMLSNHGELKYMQGMADANNCPLLSGKAPQGCQVCEKTGRCTLQDKLIQLGVAGSSKEKGE